jgi:hypothetical protein
VPVDALLVVALTMADLYDIDPDLFCLPFSSPPKKISYRSRVMLRTMATAVSTDTLRRLLLRRGRRRAQRRPAEQLLEVLRAQ